MRVAAATRGGRNAGAHVGLAGSVHGDLEFQSAANSGETPRILSIPTFDVRTLPYAIRSPIAAHAVMRLSTCQTAAL
jgi:hypothetical protein